MADQRNPAQQFDEDMIATYLHDAKTYDLAQLEHCIHAERSLATNLRGILPNLEGEERTAIECAIRLHERLIEGYRNIHDAML